MRVARHPHTCPICNERIRPGQPIGWDLSTGRMLHQRCTPEAVSPPAPIPRRPRPRQKRLPLK